MMLIQMFLDVLRVALSSIGCSWVVVAFKMYYLTKDSYINGLGMIGSRGSTLFIYKI